MDCVLFRMVDLVWPDCGSSQKSLKQGRISGMRMTTSADSDIGVGELELQFKGACAMAARRRSAMVLIEASDRSDEYETLLKAVRGFVPEAIPCMILRNGFNIEQQLASGTRLENGDVLTVLPLILGG